MNCQRFVCTVRVYPNAALHANEHVLHDAYTILHIEKNIYT